MNRSKYLHDNFYANLVLKGTASILTGFYICCSAYLMKGILEGFLVADNPLGMLSAELIEILFFGMLFLVFMFSSIALIFGGKRVSKKFKFKLWNAKTQKIAFKYLFLVALIFTALLFLLNAGFIDEIPPTLLILYGFLLFVVKNKDRKQLLILSAVCFFLAVFCFFIPSYWYSAFSTLGVAHIAYGVVVK